MDLADNYVFEITGRAMLNIVIMFITFRYLDERYNKTYKRKWIYSLAGVLGCLINFAIACLNIPILNISFWIITITLLGIFLYFDESLNPPRYYFINILFLLAVFASELIGVLLIDAATKAMQIYQQSSVMLYIRNMVGANVAVFSYYLILEPIFIKRTIRHKPLMQYQIYLIIALHLLVNIGEILFIAQQNLTQNESIFLLADFAVLLLINLFLLYLLDTFSKNKDLQHRIELYERQAQSYYRYYTKQAENYKNTLEVSQDLKEYVNFIEKISENVPVGEVKEYITEVEQKLTHSLKHDYCDNVILNVILNDTAHYCRDHGIKFDALVFNVDIDFMDEKDIFTLFGNIIDNALNACNNSEKKSIFLKMQPFNEIIYVYLSNTFAGKPQVNFEKSLFSGKAGYHTIGLENIENILEKYNGDMKIETDNDVFTIHLIFNQ